MRLAFSLIGVRRGIVHPTANVSYAIFSVESAFKNAYKSVYVHQLSIVQSQTQKGYGKKLMNEVYEIAKKNDIDLIELD